MLKNFRLHIISRVIFLAVTIAGNLYLWMFTDFYISSVLLSAFVLYQLVSLIRYVDGTNRKLSRFFESIRYADFSQSFTDTKKGESFKELDKTLAKVIDAFREQRIEKQMQFRYMQTVVQHIGISLISFNQKGDVELINTATKRLLQIPTLKKLEDLREINPRLVDTIKDLGSGERTVVKVSVGNQTLQLAMHATLFRLRDEMFKLVSIQDINAELEDKEMEAWQNLTQVLAHEIMNSVTPIASLSDTVKMLLEQNKTLHNGSYTIGKETVEDVTEALDTIQNRSNGLIRFVNSYRDFTKVPKPEPEHFLIHQLLERVYNLNKGEAQINNIKMTISADPESLELTADPSLIEQVLINLIKNAFRALHDQTNGTISLRGELSSGGHVLIHVEDNGPGIQTDNLEKIFVPFYSTRRPYKGSGSGIGLSLSRQIMRAHGGTLTVDSKPGKGTRFTMQF